MHQPVGRVAMHAVRSHCQTLSGLDAVAAQVQVPRGQANDGGRRREKPQALFQARLQVWQAARALKASISMPALLSGARDA